MLTGIREFRENVIRVENQLTRIKSIHVNAKAIREATRQIVDFYFRELRPEVIKTGPGENSVISLDAMMQDLLSATNKRTLKAVYTKLFRTIKKGLSDLEKQSLLITSGPGRNTMLGGEDQKIMETLGALMPSAASSYQQGLLDLNDVSRKSWRGTAVEFREALRECLDKLAPDEEVKGKPGFKLEQGAFGPTMKQKMEFILESRNLSKNARKAPSKAVEIVDSGVSAFIRDVYTRSAISTHTMTSKKEIIRILDYVRVTLRELLELR